NSNSSFVILPLIGTSSPNSFSPHGAKRNAGRPPDYFAPSGLHARLTYSRSAQRRLGARERLLGRARGINDCPAAIELAEIIVLLCAGDGSIRIGRIGRATGHAREARAQIGGQENSRKRAAGSGDGGALVRPRVDRGDDGRNAGGRDAARLLGKNGSD